VLVLFAGTNGIAIAGHSGEVEYAGLRHYIRDRIAAGWHPSQIIVCTMLPRAGVAESTRAAYNALITSDPGGLGYKVARLDRDAMLETMSAANYPDGTHPAEELHARIALIVAALIPENAVTNPLSRD
jgi:hypothetical protein